MNRPKAEDQEGQSPSSLKLQVGDAPGTENDQINSRILKAVKKDGSVIIERTPIAEIPAGLDAEYEYRIKRARDALANTASFSLYQLEAGSAVAPIIRSEAYREEGLNLEGFCQENFGFSRTRVLEWVVSFEMYLWLPPGARIGSSLEPVRALRKVRPEKRRDVWEIGWEKRPLRGPRTNDVERIGRKEGWLIPTKPRKGKIAESTSIPAAVPSTTKVQALGTPEDALAAIEELEALILGNLPSDCKEAILARHLLHYHERLVSNLTAATAVLPISPDQAGDTIPTDDLSPPAKSDASQPEYLDGRKFRPLTERAEYEEPTPEHPEVPLDRTAVAIESDSAQLDDSAGTEATYPVISVSDSEVTCRFCNPTDQNVFSKYGVGFSYLGFDRDAQRKLLVYANPNPVKLGPKASELRTAVDKALKAMPEDARRKVTGMLASDIRSPKERRMPCPV